MMIVKIEDFGDLPIPAMDIEPKVRLLCKVANAKIIHEWLADVAEVFLEKKKAWSFLFDKQPDASKGMIEKYFRSVNTLLSEQLRVIIMQTIRNLRDCFVRYDNGNLFSGSYEDTTFIQ